MLGDVSVEGVETDRLQGLALIEANALEPLAIDPQRPPAAASFRTAPAP